MVTIKVIRERNTRRIIEKSKILTVINHLRYLFFLKWQRNLIVESNKKISMKKINIEKTKPFFNTDKT